MRNRKAYNITKYMFTRYQQNHSDNQTKNEFCILMETVLLQLSVDSLNILSKEFMNKTVPVCIVYPKDIFRPKREVLVDGATYCRKKRAALREFINCLNTQKML